MPYAPFPIDGTVYEPNGTVASAVSIRATNMQTGDSIYGTTNSSGLYSIDLANLTGGYTNGDKILLQFSRNDTLFKYAETGIIVNTSTGFANKDVRLMGITLNTDAGRMSEIDAVNSEHDFSSNAKKVIVKEGMPDDTNSCNPSYAITFDGSNNATLVTATMETGEAFTLTITRDASGNATNVGKWVRT